MIDRRKFLKNTMIGAVALVAAPVKLLDATDSGELKKIDNSPAKVSESIGPNSFSKEEVVLLEEVMKGFDDSLAMVSKYGYKIDPLKYSGKG